MAAHGRPAPGPDAVDRAVMLEARRILKALEQEKSIPRAISRELEALGPGRELKKVAAMTPQGSGERKGTKRSASPHSMFSGALAQSKTTTGSTPRPSRTIRLTQEWTFNEGFRIGHAGGFGQVFEGEGSNGEKVAIKRIRPVTPGLATGEIRVSRALISQATEHVIPILDAGKDVESGHSYIVMPRAEESLQDRLDRDGALADEEAMVVLTHILTGLQEMAGIVHGDLKPENILLHEGKWKLADMGIAHHVDDAPKALSARMFVSEAYAAPEQWRFEPPTRLTDVYAFGCVVYAVLTGSPPFHGPSQAEYCLQHLKAAPPPLPAFAPVRALVQMCLTKDKSARPSIETALVLLRRAWSKTR